MADQDFQQGAEDQSDTLSVDEAQFPLKRKNNTLPVYGNKETMNINSMILTNIKQSPYFKTDLFKLKTFHEVVDEIFYRAEHLEPWERNSRKLSGQVGMCAGVRGVASGGIVSTPFCLLFKLFTLKLTRKQVTVMLNHVDSPYIRGLGLLYIRYCQPPNDFWTWFEPYLYDDEEIDLKAGGGFKVTVGGLCRMLLTKQDWFGTMFPRIPVNLQKVFAKKLKQINALERENASDNGEQMNEAEKALNRERELERATRGGPGLESYSPQGRRDGSSERSRRRSRSRSSERRRYRSSSEDRSRRRDRRRSGSRDRKRSRSRDRHRSRSRDRRRSRSRDRRRSRSRDRKRSRSRDRKRSRSRDRRRSRSRDRKGSRSSDKKRSRSSDRKRSRSRDRRRSRSRDRKRSRSRDRRRSRSRDRRRSRSRDRRRSKSRDRRRSRSRDRRRSRSRDRRRSSSRDRKSRDRRRSRSRERNRSSSREQQFEHDSRSRSHRTHSRERSVSKERKSRKYRSNSGERQHDRSSSNEL